MKRLSSLMTFHDTFTDGRAWRYAFSADRAFVGAADIVDAFAEVFAPIGTMRDFQLLIGIMRASSERPRNASSPGTASLPCCFVGRTDASLTQHKGTRTHPTMRLSNVTCAFARRIIPFEVGKSADPHSKSRRWKAQIRNTGRKWYCVPPLPSIKAVAVAGCCAVVNGG